MGFLDKFFNKKKIDTDNKVSDTVIYNPDRIILDMDKTEIEKTINMLAADKYYNDEGVFRAENSEFNGKDEFFSEAARLVVLHQLGSTSLIQRKLKLGYNRAGRIMDQLEEFGIVSPFNGSVSRKVFFTNLTDLNNYLQKYAGLKGKTERFYEKYKVEIDARRVQYIQNRNIEKDRVEKESIKQQLLARERKNRLEKEVLQELIEKGDIFNHFRNNEGKRELIPQDVMDQVWNRDGGKCVYCGSQENLEFDHIIPFSKGGATTYRNMQLLCKKCNLDKSNKIG